MHADHHQCPEPMESSGAAPLVWALGAVMALFVVFETPVYYLIIPPLLVLCYVLDFIIAIFDPSWPVIWHG